MFNKQRFKLFSSCILVKGFKESLIYDLERSTNYSIPNELVPLLEELHKKDINTLKKNNIFSSNDIDGFINQFLNEEIAFITTEPDAFPDINLTWNLPYEITNAILQINSNTNYNVQDAICQMDEIGCQAVQIRIETDINKNIIKKYLSYFEDTRIKCIDLILPFNAKIENQFFLDLLGKYPRIRSIKVFDAPKNMVIENNDKYFNLKIFYSIKDIRKTPSELIEKDRFIYNISIFSEAQNYNVGLNRKVCISEEGKVKNYIEHEQVFGNISDIKIVDVIAKKEFQKKWDISNDQIEKCKDCQFRYACVSNSDIEFRDQKYFKTQLCSFDPYNNIWN